jgi:hypothetical protein
MKRQTFKNESVANVSWPTGGERSVGGWRNGLKGSDEVSEVAFERRPDESEKETVTLSKVSQAERGMGRAFG